MNTINKDFEKKFHDEWADNENLSLIDIKNSNEACTAPEMRFITNVLGDLKNKELLDVGCGLGEASVYFASLGAKVTSSDLSSGMLNATNTLAKINNLKIKKHLSSAEDMKLGSKLFDVVYTGNLLHHVDVDDTVKKISKHIKKDGMFVSWDPLHYNPIINVYRMIATKVRTPDEHPLKKSDIKVIGNYFNNVETHFFWFFTLIIFILMAIVQRKNPNKERFWKVVVNEGEKWKWLYYPLEFLDKIILKIFPPLRWLCWNVVVVAKNPK